VRVATIMVIDGFELTEASVFFGVCICLTIVMGRLYGSRWDE
jgi:hypothetical protein